MESVCVLVAFGRVAQFSNNQRQRTTHSCNEKTRGYDHRPDLAESLSVRREENNDEIVTKTC